MTGDGVNDVLALKEADLGIAMGSGAPATRSVAQVVLLDSSFDGLPSVVVEGRRVLSNIERTSGLYLTKTVYAMLLSLAVGVAGLAFPFLPRHLTLIGSLTIGIPSFFLALAPSDERAQPGFLARVARFAVPWTQKLIPTPTRITAAGNKPKLIDEFVGLVNNGETRLSVAHMRSPSGWQEPGQRPEQHRRAEPRHPRAERDEQRLGERGRESPVHHGADGLPERAEHDIHTLAREATCRALDLRDQTVSGPVENEEG